MKRISTITTAIILITANLFAGSAAIAHDEVEAVYPTEGSSVEAGVIDLSITFSEEVLATDGATGFDVAVANAKGEAQPVGCISPMGTTLSARAALGEAGDYKVTWHSVSSDGHPSEGEYSFKVTGSAEVTADDVNACPKLLIAPQPVDDPSAIAYSTTSEVASNDNTATEILVLVLAVILIAGAGYWVTKNRKKSKN